MIPMLTVTCLTTSVAPGSERGVEFVAGVFDAFEDVGRERHLLVSELLDPADDFGGFLNRAAAKVRVCTVAAGSADEQVEPDWTLFTEADRVRGARLAVEDAVADDVRVIVHQVAGAPGAAGFFVRHCRQRELAGKLRLEVVQVVVGEKRCSRSGLHVDDAAPEQLSILDDSGVRVDGPLGRVAGREDVQMTVEDEVLARFAAVERRDDVGHRRLWRDDLVVETAFFHPVGQERSQVGRVAGGILARNLHHALHELEDFVGVAVKFLLQACSHCLVVHARLRFVVRRSPHRCCQASSDYRFSTFRVIAVPRS